MDDAWLVDSNGEAVNISSILYGFQNMVLELERVNTRISTLELTVEMIDEEVEALGGGGDSRQSPPTPHSELIGELMRREVVRFFGRTVVNNTLYNIDWPTRSFTYLTGPDAYAEGTAYYVSRTLDDGSTQTIEEFFQSIIDTATPTTNGCYSHPLVPQRNFRIRRD